MRYEKFIVLNTSLLIYPHRAVSRISDLEAVIIVALRRIMYHTTFSVFLYDKSSVIHAQKALH